MHRRNFIVIASLPEYWFYHWKEGIEKFSQWGIDGFEIINSAPKALDFPRRLQLEVIALCKSKNLFMTGISDNHGYGYATAAWNAVRLPGWRDQGPASLETMILSHLRRNGYASVQVIERTRMTPEHRIQLYWDPLVNGATFLRQLNFIQASILVLWLWLAAGVALTLRKIHLI
jgi:sugar phosphate isomerase/epimerase